MDRFIPFGGQELFSDKYYGGRDITGRLLPRDYPEGWQAGPETIVWIDIESEYNALIEALDGKVVKP